MEKQEDCVSYGGCELPTWECSAFCQYYNKTCVDCQHYQKGDNQCYVNLGVVDEKDKPCKLFVAI